MIKIKKSRAGKKWMCKDFWVDYEKKESCDFMTLLDKNRIKYKIIAAYKSIVIYYFHTKEIK